MSTKSKRIWVGAFGACMLFPTMTWALLAQSELMTPGLLGTIASVASVLAGWALISSGWEPGLRASFGSLSIVQALGGLAMLCVMWTLAAMLYRVLTRYEQEHPRSPFETIIW